MIVQVETLMYQLSDWFMAPVLVLICLLFIYTLFAAGRCSTQYWQRRRHRQAFNQFLAATDKQSLTVSQLGGYPLAQLRLTKLTVSQDELDLLALKHLEGLRNVSRLAPMLGLIATMIPMGPALKSLAQGNIQGISENLIVAFSAVIFGLVIASATYWMASVKKRWLAEELVLLTPVLVNDPVENVDRVKPVENHYAAA